MNKSSNNTAKKSELTKSHIILFVVSLLAVLLTFGSYVRGALQERQLATASANNAGNPGAGGFNPQQMAARRLEQMTQQLQLTAEQSAKIKAIYDSEAPRTKVIYDDTTLTRQQRRDKMRPIRAESDAQIKQVLTPEQQTKFDEMQTQRRAQFGGTRGGRAAGNTSGNTIANPPPPPPKTP